MRLVVFISALAAYIASVAPDDTGQQTATRGVGGRAVAFTFDDLPARGDLANVRETTEKLLRTLVAERVPAIGFVNEVNVDVPGEADARTALLEAWLDAGFDLGNHTYSHVSIDRVPLESYKADVIRGERITRGLLEARGGRLRYFRHPQLRTGPTAEYKAGLDGFLTERGYRVAPVTIDHNEFVLADL